MLPVPATGHFPLLDDLRETIGEESGNQSYSPGCGLTASQSSDISASRRSSGMVTLPTHAAFQRFPWSPPRWPDGCQRAAALSYRDAAAALPDIVEQCEAFRLELSHAYDAVRHIVIITGRS